MASSSYKVCTVPCCTSTTIKSPNKLFIHVPQSGPLRKKWLQLARRDPSTVSPKSSIYFCEDHFDLPNDMENYMAYHIMGSVSAIRMKPSCVPTKFECQPDRLKRTATTMPRSAVVKRQRASLIEEILAQEARPVLKKCAVPSQFPWNESSSMYLNAKEQHQRCLGSSKKKFSVQDAPVQVNIVKEEEDSNLMEATNYIEVEIKVEKQNDIGIQCDLCEDSNFNTLIKCPKNEMKRKESSIENVLDVTNAAEVEFYTGFQDYEHIKSLFSLFGDEVNCLKYHPQMKTLKVSFLNPCDQFLLVLIKLRRNMLFKELSFRLKINKTILSNIFITWINYLYCKLKELNVGVPKQCTDKNMKPYSKNNPYIVIVDCRKIKIEKPKNPLTQQLTYFTYKSANTLPKVLVKISESGCVTLVSDAYGGSTSDGEMFEKCGLIDKLHPNDINSGFNGQDLEDKDVKVPELKNTDGRLETSQLKSEKIPSERIQVQRVIGLAKTFKILNSNLDSKFVNLANRIIFVCFMVNNLKNNIMK